MQSSSFGIDFHVLYAVDGAVSDLSPSVIQFVRVAGVENFICDLVETFSSAFYVVFFLFQREYAI
jgi:hypothetical protein